MKKIITAICCTAMMFYTKMPTVYAAEMLDRDYIESEIWEDMWNGKSDDGTTSYKHHLLEEWLDDNYGSDEYDWAELGELKYEYKRYYQHIIEDWDFNDDDNGDTVESFPPFSTLEDVEDSADSESYEIHDDGEDSPRVIGKVAGGTEKPFDGTDTAEGTDAAESLASSTEGDSVRSGASPLMIGGTVGAIAVIGGVGFYLTRKKK